jgi:alkylated DNA repair dioxygenase AlkB
VLYIFHENIKEMNGDNLNKIVYDANDADIELYENFYPEAEASIIMKKIIEETNWRQDTIKIYGKNYPVPRLTALYGDNNKPYTYSGITMQPNSWSPTLHAVKLIVENLAQTTFTSVLINYYRNGKDSMGWHRDNEKELGTNPVIASVSFGQTRPFHMRHKFNKDIKKIVLPLTHGSILIMKGKTQHYWEHQVPKSIKITEPRINLTFRKIVLV